MKRIVLYVVWLSILITAGCGNKISKEEIITNAVNKDINSVELNGTVHVKVSSQNQFMTQSMDLHMKFIQEPFLSYMKLNTIDGKLELYIDEDTTYMKSPDMNQWLKVQTKSVPELAAMASDNSLKKEFERLHDFINLYELEKAGDDYILKVKLNESADDQEIELVKNIIVDAAGDTDFEITNLNSFDYEITLDKNYLLKSAESTIDTELKFGEKIDNFIVEINVNYKNFNNVKAFSVPDNIVNNARTY
ncbi:MAG: hypothetical protein H0Z32_01345 [Bacillaceae bacterium]|nr:hypothetical protein [Bacillaceae bacterium]